MAFRAVETSDESVSATCSHLRLSDISDLSRSLHVLTRHMTCEEVIRAELQCFLPMNNKLRPVFMLRPAQRHRNHFDILN